MFENLKQWFLRRIEERAVKSELDGEIVYLKKSKIPLVGDWGRIYPAVNEDGTWNFTNLIFGGKQNFIKLILILIIIAFVLLGFYEVFNQYSNVVNNECVKLCLKKIS